MTTISGPTIDAARALDVALCRSLLYQALALGFRTPTARTLSRLAGADETLALAEAAAVLDADGGTGLAPKVRALAASPDAGTSESLAATYRHLFGHTVRGPIPPYETEYGDDTLFQKPQEMSDIAGFLRAFGLVVDPRRSERIDHVSCELEFLAFLSRKEAHALETGDEAMRAETRRATRLFLKDHLARFVPSFTQRVESADPGGFYGRLAALCRDLVRSECARFEAPAGPEMLRLRLPLDDNAPIACGGAEGCAPGPGGPGDATGACGPEACGPGGNG
ncbi:MAG TPA: molecular chaperone TorD family protein [Candidatus Polarisedimenticolia bacterium]|nr:molecular chaperone TorD family protein [Candidatus Polarisedimenticolia bacterium]